MLSRPTNKHLEFNQKWACMSDRCGTRAAVRLVNEAGKYAGTTQAASATLGCDVTNGLYVARNHSFIISSTSFFFSASVCARLECHKQPQQQEGTSTVGIDPRPQLYNNTCVKSYTINQLRQYCVYCIASSIYNASESRWRTYSIPRRLVVI